MKIIYGERNGIYMSKNDDKILELKKKVEESKRELGKPKRFQPITTCMIEINGQRKNINVINNLHELNYIMINLHMFKLSADDLGIDVNDFNICGFTYDEWVNDLRQKREIIIYKQKETELKTMEAKLERLLSDDKKVELELDEIEKLLK